MKQRYIPRRLSSHSTKKLLYIMIVLGLGILFLILVSRDKNPADVISSNRTFLNVYDNITLNNGVKMPVLGFGTAGLGNDAKNAISDALDTGYLLYDSASDTGPWYKTEKIIGDLYKEKGFKREDLFITTKLHPQDFPNVRESFEQSLRNLKTDYIDLYLLHYSKCWGNLCPEPHNVHFLTVWEELEKLYDEKKIRALGISNFDVDDIKLLVKEARIRPHVLQSRFDPFAQPWNKVRLAKIYGIAFQSYSQLGSQWKMKYNSNPVLENEVLKSIAHKYNKSIPQIVLKWLLQENILVIPKSKSKEHIKENIDIFDFTLSNEHLGRIRMLDKTL